ncbi:MAG: AAA family ATPase [Lysobacteraceae bacterium]
MKLLYVELIGQYKGLSDQSFDLSSATGGVLAMIGLNGSGKSQLMELIAEIFSYLERVKRTDFVTRRHLGFHFRIAYEWMEEADPGLVCYVLQYLPKTQLHAFRSLPSVVAANDLPSELGQWLPGEKRELVDVPLPRMIGYASGLNENLQRPFMRNALQYYDVMRIRAGRRTELQRADVDEEIAIEINQRYRKRHPRVFGYANDLEIDSNPLVTREADTPLPGSIFLDYDCAHLVVGCLGLLFDKDRDGLWPEISHRHPKILVLRYDLRNFPIEEDSIRDIKQLIGTLGQDNLVPLSAKVPDPVYDRYELDYLRAEIVIDFSNAEVVSRLRDTYGEPIRLFWKLYKLQLLGTKQWTAEAKKFLMRDDFQGHVKKPLKGKLPLSVAELQMSDGIRNIPIDDLSDGETQLLHTIGAVRLFGQEQTLFLMDEPETHLNPSWRTRYHIDFTNTGIDPDRSQALISSHSPFLISSLERSNVFHFEKIEERTMMTNPDDETFGASFEVLIKKYFGLRSVISQTAVESIQVVLADASKTKEEKRAWIEENIGQSIDRVYLLKSLGVV